MTERLNPVTQQRRLRADLRQGRVNAGMSQQQVADALDWSLSKVIRIEHGAVKVSVTDLRAMLTLYKITDDERINELITIARLGKQQHWWDDYRKVISSNFLQFVELEASAIRNRQFQSSVMPGLLQTRAYATNVLWAYHQDEGQEKVDRYANFRLKRQDVLAGKNGEEFYFILDEALLHRRVGTAEEMREQLAHLKEVNRQPNVTIQVLPFSAGAHRAIRASFIILEVPIGSGDDTDITVSLQGTLGDILVKNDAEKASEYLELFMSLEELAAPSGELDQIIDAVMSSGS